MSTDEEKLCTRCGNKFPLTEDFWYKARPTATHRNGGWQSHCRSCWKVVNHQNKQRRKAKTTTDYQMHGDSAA